MARFPDVPGTTHRLEADCPCPLRRLERLVLLITRFKVNAFISLLLASMVVGSRAVLLGRCGMPGKESAYNMLRWRSHFPTAWAPLSAASPRS